MDICKAYYNGCLACSPFGSIPDPLEIGTDDASNLATGLYDVLSHNGQGALKLCGFRSNNERLHSFSGVYRAAAGDEGGEFLNGGLPYRYPLALFTGLFSADCSGYVPVGMMAQQASSGIQLRWQLAQGVDVVEEGSRRKSILLACDGLNNIAVPDGVGADVRKSDPFGIYSPTITYRSLLILDQELMQTMQAIFEGQVAEMVTFGGSNVPIYRNLMLKYPSHRVFDYIHRSGVPSSYYSIPIAEPSVRGIFVRFVRTGTTVNTTVDWDADGRGGKGLIVRSMVFKIGSSTYPLEAIRNESATSLALIAPTNLTNLANFAFNNQAIRDQNVLDSSALMSAYDLEGKHIFSPFREVSYASTYEDLGSHDISLGLYDYERATIGAFTTRRQTRTRIHPFTMSLENSSSTLETHELTRDALFGCRGLDLRGISDIRFEVTLGQAGGDDDRSVVAPTSDVRVVLGVMYDSVMQISRGSINTEAQYSLF
jgi:hypothetical protein